MGTTSEGRSQRVARVRAPQQQRGEETVEAIRAAAQRLLGGGGSTRVTVIQIARAAKVSVGAFYHFFESRDALLLDLRGQLYQRVLASLMELVQARPLESGRDFRDGIEALLHRWLEISLQSRGLERAVAAASHSSVAFARGLRRQELQAERLVATMIRSYAASGRVREVDPDAGARLVVLLVDALIVRAMRDRDVADAPGPMLREASRMLARYLVAPAPAPTPARPTKGSARSQRKGGAR